MAFDIQRQANEWGKIMRFGWLAAALLLSMLPVGCGTSVWSDTKRTATEQLLISDAMDRAVSKLDFRALTGKQVFLDDSAVQTAVDHEYLTSSLRQHMLASGCWLKDNQQDADYIVELRAGAVGTDRHDVLYGVPSVNVPTVLPLSGVPTAIPEIPFVKKTDQRAVVKIAVFAYNRKTGRPVWQSGIVPVESLAKDFWFFGAGPFQRGTIYEGMSFAGGKLDIPLIDVEKKWGGDSEAVSVADEACFIETGAGLLADQPGARAGSSSSKVVQAAVAEPAPELPAEKASTNPSDSEKRESEASQAEPHESQQTGPTDHADHGCAAVPDGARRCPSPPALLPPETLLDSRLWSGFPDVGGEIPDIRLSPPPVSFRFAEPSQPSAAEQP